MKGAGHRLTAQLPGQPCNQGRGLIYDRFHISDASEAESQLLLVSLEEGEQRDARKKK